MSDEIVTVVDRNEESFTVTRAQLRMVVNQNFWNAPAATLSDSAVERLRELAGETA